jgi:hypothetical protein
LLEPNDEVAVTDGWRLDHRWPLPHEQIEKLAILRVLECELPARRCGSSTRATRPRLSRADPSFEGSGLWLLSSDVLVLVASSEFGVMVEVEAELKCPGRLRHLVSV